MKYKKWDNFKVHASGISRIMARPKGCNNLTDADKKKVAFTLSKEELTPEDITQVEFFIKKENNFKFPPLSETAKSYLIERYSTEKYNIRRVSLSGVQSASAAKGTVLETEGIKLVSKVDNKEYETPKETVFNDYILGKCDGICIANNALIEIKTSWNSANFMANRRSGLQYSAWAQMQGYLDIYNLNSGEVCYVLVNTPPHLIEQERLLAFKKYTFGEIDRDKYESKIELLETVYDYNKIPESKRIIRFQVDKSTQFLDKVYNKVGLCRAWLNEFEKEFMLNKKIVTLDKDYVDVIQYKDSNT